MASGISYILPISHIWISSNHYTHNYLMVSVLQGILLQIKYHSHLCMENICLQLHDQEDPATKSDIIVNITKYRPEETGCVPLYSVQSIAILLFFKNRPELPPYTRPNDQLRAYFLIMTISSLEMIST